MEARLTPVPVVAELAARLPEWTVGLYVGGSVASGDYRPGVSDVDAVALVDRRPAPAERRGVVAMHRRLVRDCPTAAALHCVYLPRTGTTDLRTEHWTWAFDELFRRPFGGIARAELLADPVVVSGPLPSTWLPAMGPDDVREAARAELAGYWSRAVRRRAIWEQDVYVDQGVTAVARADLTIRTGRLVTKAEAIRHLTDLGLPAAVGEGVGRRRLGGTEVLTDAARRARAETARRFVRQQIARLLDPVPA